MNAGSALFFCFFVRLVSLPSSPHRMKQLDHTKGAEKMKKSQKMMSITIYACKGSLISLAVGAALLTLFSWMIEKGWIPVDLMGICVIVVVICASFIGGAIAVRMQRGAVITGLAAGVILLIGMTVATALGHGGNFSGAQYSRMVVSIFTGSFVGSTLGSYRRKSGKRHYSR